MEMQRVLDVWRGDGFSGLSEKTKAYLHRKSKRGYSYVFPRKPVLSTYGVYLYPNWGDVTFEMCAYGRYGQFLSDYIANIDYRFIFLDIGANQGLYSLLAVKNGNCVHVHAFEPVKKTFELLAANIAANNVQGEVIPHHYGISTQESLVPIFLTNGHSGAASLRSQSIYEVSETVEIKAAAAIDQLISSGEPIVIKIDVEGHEKEVISSIAETAFAERVKAIFYEVDEAWVKPRDIVAILSNMGFNRFQKIGSGTHYDVIAER